MLTEKPDTLPVGTKVLIDRDEEEYPSMGTWSRYRGRKGVIVSINLETFKNNDDIPKGYHLEYGVNFSVDSKSKRLTKTETDVWFLPHEVRVL